MTADDLRAESNMPMRPLTKGRMLKEAAAEIERLTAENERLRAALAELVDVLPKIDEGTRGIFSIAAVHGAYYRGPTWKTELENAQAALAAFQQLSVNSEE